MARNGSGTYSLPSGNPVTTGTTISSTTHNDTLSDIATALTNSLAKDGQTTPTADIPLGSNKITGLASATVVTDAAQFGQVLAYSPKSGSDTGTDTYEVNMGLGLSSGDIFAVDFGSANTTATPTLENTGGTPSGAKSIKTVDGSQYIGMIAARPHWMKWDGTDFIVMDPTVVDQVLDEDDFSSNSATKAPSQQSAEAFIKAPYSATDGGTDAFSGDFGPLATNDVIKVDIGSANTTASPTLENSGGSPSGAKSVVPPNGSAYIGMLEARPHRFQWDGTDFVVLDPAGLRTPNGSSGVSPGFGSWRTPDSDRPVLVEMRIHVETNGTSFGRVHVQVDESGGTSADYFFRSAADPEWSSGASDVDETITFLLPPGGAYQIVNQSDPNSGNTIDFVREYTL